MLLIFHLILHNCSFIQVFAFDYELARGKLLIEQDVPVAFTAGVEIRKDHVLVERPHEFEVILINWRTRSAAVIDFSASAVGSFAPSRLTLLTPLQGWCMNVRAAFATDDDVVVTLHAPAFCLISLSLSQLDGRWSTSTNSSDWKITTFTLSVAGGHHT